MRQLLPSILFITSMFLVLSNNAFAKDELKDFSGKPQTLESLTGQGKWSIIMFWAYDCHVCNKEAHEYVAFHKRHKNIDAEVIGVSLDGASRKKQAEDFIARHKLNFINLIGEPYDVAGIFEDLTGSDWVGTPSFLIYGPKGELKAQQVGAVPVDLIEKFMEKESKNPQ